MSPKKASVVDPVASPLRNETLRAFRLCYSKASVGNLALPLKGGPTDVEQHISVSSLPSDTNEIVKAEINFSLAAGEFLDIAASYYIEISTEETPQARTGEAALHAIGVNAIVSVAWPYWRSHLARLLIEFGLPPMKLPIFPPVVLTEKDVRKQSVRHSLADRSSSSKLVK
jgi:hypothetical protein